MTVKFFIMTLIIYICGIVAGRVTCRRKPDGVFLIDRRSATKDILQIALDIDVDEMESRDYILLKIKKPNRE